MKIKKIDRLYHGTINEFERIDLSKSGLYKDFGRGFYLTSSFLQAQNWAQLKAKRYHKGSTYIYSYRCNTLGDISLLNIKELLEYNEEWIDFITLNRKHDIKTDYDIIYDRMADNRGGVISKIVDIYEAKEINTEEAIKKLKWVDTKGNYDQYCFKTKKAIELLIDKKVIVQECDKEGNWKQIKE